MPYSNEHANRVKDPGEFQKNSFRRKVISPGVSIIVGKPTGSDKMVVQSYRFDREKFTAEEAKKWLADHNVKGGSFEAATGKEKAQLTKDGMPASCYLVVEDPQKVTTWHLPVKTPDGKPDHNLMGAAWAALHRGYRGQKYEGPGKQDAILKLHKLYQSEGMKIPTEKGRLKEDNYPEGQLCPYCEADLALPEVGWYKCGNCEKTLFADASDSDYEDYNAYRQEERKDEPKDVKLARVLRKPSGEKSFKVFKQANGEYRWVAFSSSAFRDLDGELITVKALEEDCDRCDKTGDYGPLRWWHVGAAEAPNGPEDWATWKAGKGIDLGTCDFNMVQGRMLIESGTFKDAATGEAFAIPEVQANLQLSIAFAHPANEPNEKAVFDNIHRFERSLLPYGTASNLLTRFAVTGEKSMKIEDKLNALIAILKGKPEVAKQILEDAASVQKAAEDAGLEYKEVTAMLEDTPAQEGTPEQPAAETPEAPTEEAIPDTVGNMTLPELQATIMDVFRAQLEPTQKEAATKEAESKQLQADTIAAIKSISDRLAQMETSLTKTQQSLQELTDARPVGIKQLQTRRPTEQESNVTTTPIVGPHIDEGFLDFFKRR